MDGPHNDKADCPQKKEGANETPDLTIPKICIQS